MKKILVPIDFSDISRNALHFALSLAEKNQASVTLLNSVHFDYYSDYQYGTFSSAKTLMDDVKDAMAKKMEDFMKTLDTSVEVNMVISDSSLVTSVKEMVPEQGYDLIVIGTQGCTGLEEALIGSNTEKIVRHSPCPVISVPSKTEVDQINRILIPLDIREIKPSFLDKVAALQKHFEAEIEFLWVKTPHNVENEESVSEELTKLIQSHGVEHFDFTIVRNVFPSDGILWHAEDTNADMIAMATHARRGISHWLSGSLTEDTVNHIKVPVWSFRMEKKEKPVSLKSIKEAHGKPEYKKIEVLTTD